MNRLNPTSQRASRPVHNTEQKPVKNNLSNRFSVAPLQPALVQQAAKAGLKQTSAYEKTIKIAKIAAGVVITAAVAFAAYHCLSGPGKTVINCNQIKSDFNGETDCKFDNGARYEGSVKDGLFSGNGTYINPSDEKFKGPFKSNQFVHNSDSITLEELDACKVNNLVDCVESIRQKDCVHLLYKSFTGSADCSYKDGARYKGPVENGYFSGNNGSYTNPSNVSFTGTFQDHEFLHNNDLIALEELDACKVANSTACLESIQSNCSHFIDTEFTGFADCSYEDGAKYKGLMEDGLFSGAASYTNPFNVTFTGIFEDDTFLYNGNSIELEELDACKVANLTACLESVQPNCNDLTDAEFTGSVDCSYEDGASYQGLIEEGWFSGLGSYTNSLFKETFTGTFEDHMFLHNGDSIELTELDACKVNGLADCVASLRKQS